jgi:replicative DNA helicase
VSQVHVKADLPRADEAEQAVLGAVILHNPQLAEVAGILRAEHFAQGWCRLVYAAMLQLAKKNQPIDFVTVKDALGDKALDDVGLMRLVKLGEGVPRATNIGYYADIVIDAARRRWAIQKATEVIDAALEPAAGADDVLTLAQESFFRLAQTKRADTMWSAAAMTMALYERLEKMSQSDHAMTGLPSGIARMDALTNGFQPGDLIVIGARPSVGKTGFALQLALHVAKQGGWVLFCSLEMGQAPVWDRALWNESRVDGFRYKRGFYRGDEDTDRRISNTMSLLSPLPLQLDEQPGMTSVDIRSKAQQVQLRYGLALVVVDYLQLMHDAGGDRSETLAQRVGNRAKDLKELARTLNVPVIVLSQLRRLEEGKRPTLADLKESGDIEAHADIVMLLHRIETIEQMDELEVGEPVHVEAILAKQRGNPTAVVRLLNYREQFRFVDETRGDPDPHTSGELFGNEVRRTA